MRGGGRTKSACALTHVHPNFDPDGLALCNQAPHILTELCEVGASKKIGKVCSNMHADGENMPQHQNTHQILQESGVKWAQSGTIRCNFGVAGWSCERILRNICDVCLRPRWLARKGMFHIIVFYKPLFMVTPFAPLRHAIASKTFSLCPLFQFRCRRSGIIHGRVALLVILFKH